jgi:hypothetical protein
MYSSCLWHSLVLPCNHRFRPRMQMQEWMHEHDPCRAEMATLIQSGNGSFDQNGWLGFRVR